MNEPIILKRECAGIQIPSGEKMLLPGGMEVTLAQSLGGSYTVVTEQGYMVRISGGDADALGLENESAAKSSSEKSEGEPLEKQVWDQMRTCYDPEIPANIVELGLIYECRIEKREENRHSVYVQMTLTAPGCGMGDILKADVEEKLKGLAGVSDVQVELVVDPPWTPDRMSDAARLQLGMM